MKPDRNTPVSDVIKDLPPTPVTVAQLAKGKGSYPDLWPKLLLACEGDQMNFLIHLWDKVVPTHESKLVWIGLIKNGFFTTCLDTDAAATRDLVRAASYAVEVLKEQNDRRPQECSRCRRVRR